MNTYHEREDFVGCYEPKDFGGSLQGFWEHAAKIRERLENKGYLLDTYLSHIFHGMELAAAFKASEKGFDICGQLRMLCSGILENDDKNKNHSLYGKIKHAFSELQQRERVYQESRTQKHLLFAALADEFLCYAVNQYRKEVSEYLVCEIDLVETEHLYIQICRLIGESLMEELNLRLKQRFQVVTNISGFVQGASNDLLYCITNRDDETSKQIFQLVIDEVDTLFERESQ